MHTPPDWFDSPEHAAATESGRGERGLRFACTMCGNCCTGPPGYVLFTDEEAARLARRVGVSLEVFYRDYTHATRAGRSLREVPSEHGLDCIFLDRTRIAGKAVCGVYEDRPQQCRTWPFWPGNLRSPAHWREAARGCPGIGRGPLTPPQQIRVLRDSTPR